MFLILSHIDVVVTMGTARNFLKEKQPETFLTDLLLSHALLNAFVFRTD
jgi:hypothetical protein